MSLRVTDIFAGAGLFSAGAQRAGFHVVEAIELDREAVASYRSNVSGLIKHGSVQALSPSESTDLLIAGPPCQGFSTLGRRDPSDVRNALSLEIPRWARLSGAKVIVIENVPPFLRSPQWTKLVRVLRRGGYSVEIWQLDAYDFGAPQLRRRAFTVASKVGRIGAPAPTGRGPTAAAALAGLEGRTRADDALHTWPEPKGIAAERIALIPACGDKRDLIRLRPELCPPSWLRMGVEATDVWGRVEPNLPANTLRCTFQNPSKGRYLHMTENRCLSLREGARLQGIPDTWQLQGRPYPVARQIGNGVPIPLAAAVSRRVYEALS